MYVYVVFFIHFTHHFSSCVLHAYTYICIQLNSTSYQKASALLPFVERNKNVMSKDK